MAKKREGRYYHIYCADPVVNHKIDDIRAKIENGISEGGVSSFFVGNAREGIERHKRGPKQGTPPPQKKTSTPVKRGRWPFR